jgi:hypothetical protein
MLLSNQGFQTTTITLHIRVTLPAFATPHLTSFEELSEVWT